MTDMTDAGLSQQPGMSRSQFLRSAMGTAYATGFLKQEPAPSPWKAGTFDCHLEEDGSACYDIVLRQSIRAPFRDPKSTIWELVLPVPPTSPSQQSAGVSFVGVDEAPDATVVRVQDSSPVGRIVNLIRLNGEPRVGSGLTVSTKFQLKVIGRRLVQGRGKRPEPLAADLKRFFLRTSESIDHSNPEFQKWLDEAGLRRGKSEGDLDFGHRSFLYVHKHYVHDQVAKVPPPKYYTVSRLCKDRVMGCGHSSNLHVAILRANGVPARVLSGRHARTSDIGSDVWHVCAEFWCESVGWIPVNHGIIAERYNPDDFFGKSLTSFVTLLEDNDLEVMKYRGGRTTISFLQSVFSFWYGGGNPESWSTSERWQVDKLTGLAAKPAPQRINLLPALGAPGWDSEFDMQPDGASIKLVTGSGKGKPRGRFLSRASVGAIRNGRKYLLEFRARADKNRDILVRSSSELDGLAPIGLDEPIGLTAEWQTFGITFQAKDVGSAGNWAPLFSIQRTEGAVWLSDVKMVEL